MKNTKRESANVPGIEPKKNPRAKPSLRSRAEKHIAENPGIADMSSANSLKLVHELQVHQIELEMQNQELESTKTAAEESSIRFSDLYNFSPVGYVTLDEKGIILEANLTFVQMTGLDKKHILQKPFCSFVVSEDESGFLEFFHRLVPSNTKAEVEIRITRKDGSIFYAQIEAIGFKKSEKSFQQYLLAILDITDRIETQKLLLIRSEQLVFANKELEAFSYSVSHDLRAPLRAMMGFSSILLREHSSQLDAEGLAHLKRISSAAEKMNELIDDILNLAKISRQEMTTQLTDLSEMVQGIVSLLKMAEPARIVDVVISQCAKANCDARLMNVALSNLVENAWKYSSKTATAKIEFGTTEKDGHEAYFVKDNGVGFDMKQSKKLFAPFQRLHSETQFPGTGIGLAIVNRVIQRHGGKIWAESEIDKGATFSFTLS